jgi:hypothetical protein
MSFLDVADLRNYQQQGEISSQPFSTNTSTTQTSLSNSKEIILDDIKPKTIVPQVQAHATVDYSDKQKPEKHSQRSLPDYVQKHCDFRINLSKNDTDGDAQEMEDWWPANATDWRRRAPAALIIGAKKAGTTSLFLSLRREIASPRVKELLYFIPHRFKGWENGITGNKVLVHQARHIMYNEGQDYPIDFLKQNPHAISMEATPDYLLYSTYSAQAILCTAPWVKLIVLLRHPIDRLFSHYNFLIDPNLGGVTNLPTFDEWVEADIRMLQRFGILPRNLSNIEEHFGSEQERNGWQDYQKTFYRISERPVARSLYAIQLEEWFHHLRQVGKDPEECVKIFRSTDLKQRQDTVVKEILNWIGIVPTVASPTPPPKQLQQAERGNKQQEHIAPHPIIAQPKTQPQGMVTKYSSRPMKKETRQKLELLFAPYNRRLYRLLGPEWEGAFDAR